MSDSIHIFRQRKIWIPFKRLVRLAAKAEINLPNPLSVCPSSPPQFAVLQEKSLKMHLINVLQRGIIILRKYLERKDKYENDIPVVRLEKRQRDP